MEASQKKNAILIAVAVLLMIGALVFGFRDSLFSSASPTAAVDDQTGAAVADALGTVNTPQPDAPNPPPRGSGKRPAGTN